MPNLISSEIDLLIENFNGQLWNQTKVLEEFFAQAIEANSNSEDEQIWFNNVEKMAETWT